MASTSWKATAGGSWDGASNWTNGVPGVADIATISLSGTYAVTLGSAADGYVDAADTVTLNGAGATLRAAPGAAATLRLAHDFYLKSGLLDLTGVTLQGGNYHVQGGAYRFGDGSVLSGVTWDGDLRLNAGGANPTVALRDGLTLNQTGAALPVLDVGSATAFAVGDLTLDGITANLSGGTLVGPASAGDTLTLGPRATVGARGTAWLVSGGGGSIVNYGTVNAYLNNGTPNQLSVNSAFANYGAVEIGRGSALIAVGGYDFTNGGQIDVIGGTLALGSYTETGSGLIRFVGTGGTLLLTGTGPYAATVFGFQAGDVIKLGGVNFRDVGGTALNGNVLDVTDPFGASLARVTLLGAAYAPSNLSFAADANGALTITTTASSPVTAPDFDPAYYLARNPDVAAAGVDPQQHYRAHGWREGRDPSALFSTAYYLNQNPDVAAAGVDPLRHYETSGWKEGRDPSALFSTSKYLAANPDVKAAGLDPLAHYAISGRPEGRTAATATPRATGSPDLAVDYAYYYAQHPDVAAAGLDASAHYHATGWKLGYNPDAYFDTKYYLTANPDVAAAGLDPLQHYEASGWKEGRDPSLAFSISRYLSANPDVKAAGIDPLQHYIAGGRAEGRMAFVSGPAATGSADPLVDVGYYFGQLATIVPSGVDATASYSQTGWRLGLDPNAYFDTDYYLARYPDVAAAGVDPLRHYETTGWEQGRDPSALFSTSKYQAAYPDVQAAGVNPLLDYVTSGQTAGRIAFPV